MSDGYNAYRRFLKRCRCWAHLLRKAQGLGGMPGQRGATLRAADGGCAGYLDGSHPDRAGRSTGTPVYRGYMAIFWKTIGLNASG